MKAECYPGRAWPRALFFFVAVWSLQSLSATELAQTQFKGLTGVNVAVHMMGDLRTQSDDLGRFVKGRVEKQLTEAGLALLARNGETLRVEIEGVRSGASSFAVRISARLIEHVALRRNPASDVPGGGAITWWHDGLTVCSEGKMKDTLGEALDYFIGELTDEWKIENPSASKERKSGAPSSH